MFTLYALFFLAPWSCLRVFSASCWAGSWVISLARRFLDGTLQPPGLYCMLCVNTAMPQDCMLQLSCVLVWSDSERRKNIAHNSNQPPIHAWTFCIRDWRIMLDIKPNSAFLSARNSARQVVNSAQNSAEILLWLLMLSRHFPTYCIT